VHVDELELDKVVNHAVLSHRCNVHIVNLVNQCFWPCDVLGYVLNYSGETPWSSDSD
jgi:hypothetical protein